MPSRWSSSWLGGGHCLDIRTGLSRGSLGRFKFMVSLQPQLSLPKGSQNGTGKPIFIWLLKCYSWARFFFFFFFLLSVSQQQLHWKRMNKKSNRWRQAWETTNIRRLVASCFGMLRWLVGIGPDTKACEVKVWGVCETVGVGAGIRTEWLREETRRNGQHSSRKAWVIKRQWWGKTEKKVQQSRGGMDYSCSLSRPIFQKKSGALCPGQGCELRVSDSQCSLPKGQQRLRLSGGEEPLRFVSRGQTPAQGHHPRSPTVLASPLAGVDRGVRAGAWLVRACGARLLPTTGVSGKA